MESKLRSSLKLRESVQWFAQEMERKLRTHDKDRGSRGWIEEHPADMFLKLEAEVNELREYLPDALSRSTVTVPCPDFADLDLVEAKSVLRETVDVANFAMMIADILQRQIGLSKKRGGLK